MTKKSRSRRHASAPASAGSIPPVSPTETMNVKQYDVIVNCVLPRGGALVFDNAGFACPPYIQQGQRMFKGMLIESAPEYVDELVSKGKIVERETEPIGE